MSQYACRRYQWITGKWNTSWELKGVLYKKDPIKIDGIVFYSEAATETDHDQIYAYCPKCYEGITYGMDAQGMVHIDPYYGGEDVHDYCCTCMQEGHSEEYKDAWTESEYIQ